MASFLQDTFTLTERRILAVLCTGASNKIIARELNMSENLLKTHMKSLFIKARVHTRTQAVVNLLPFVDEARREAAAMDAEFSGKLIAASWPDHAAP